MNQPGDSSPIFERIVGDHANLRDLLGEMHRIVVGRSETVDNVVKSVNTLIDFLRQHFKREEDDGFFGEIAARAPRLSERAEDVSREHIELLAAIESFRDTALGGTATGAWWERLNSEFHRLMKDLMHHERREQDLLQEAFNVDIGTAD